MRKLGFVGGLLLLGLLAGSAAAAEPLEGVAIVLENNAAAGTILIEPPIITVQVTPQTVITGLDGERIELGALPSAVKMEGGGYEVRGDLAIRFEAERDGDKVTAVSIQRMHGVLD